MSCWSHINTVLYCLVCCLNPPPASAWDFCRCLNMGEAFWCQIHFETSHLFCFGGFVLFCCFLFFSKLLFYSLWSTFYIWHAEAHTVVKQHCGPLPRKRSGPQDMGLHKCISVCDVNTFTTGAHPKVLWQGLGLSPELPPRSHSPSVVGVSNPRALKWQQISQALLIDSQKPLCTINLGNLSSLDRIETKVLLTFKI